MSRIPSSSVKSFLKSSSQKTNTNAEKRKEGTEGGGEHGGRGGKKLHRYLLWDPGQEVGPHSPSLSFLFLKVKRLVIFNIPFSS